MLIKMLCKMIYFEKICDLFYEFTGYDYDFTTRKKKKSSKKMWSILRGKVVMVR